MPARHRAFALVFLGLLLATGCGSVEPTATSMPATATRIAPAETATSLPPTATPASPTATAIPPSPTQTPVLSAATSSPMATAIPTEPAPTIAPVEVEEISFQSDHFTVVGDLQIPGPGGKRPAIIMVHGDGGIDRYDSGNYRPIMERFLRAGYAVFSWDKPGTGESTGELARDSEVLSQRTSILVSAIERLKEHPAVDPERIGVWGISQAGYVMPLALTKTDDIAFMIVISGPAMDSYDQGAYLVGQLAFCAGASEEEARLIEQQTSRAEKATIYQEYLENIVPLHEHPILTDLGIFRNVHSEDEWSPEDPSKLSFFDPIEVIEQTTIPVLAFFGEKDKQVDPLQGAQAYREALQAAGNQNYRVELVPGVNHVLGLADTGCLNEHRSRVYAPEYLDVMEEWLVQVAASLLPLDDSGGGVIAFVRNWDIYLMNADGTDVRRLTTHRSRDAWPTWSPDGKQIAFMSERNGRWNVFVMDVDQGESSVRRLTSSNMTWEPAWSPDGAWIAFGSPRGNNSEIYVMDASASASTARRLTDHRNVDGYPCWSPDSAQIAFVSDRDGNWEIYAMNVDGSDVRRLTAHDADDWDPDWSPDGTRIAFASRRDGNMEIYVMNADGSDPRRLTDHAADDLNPSWSPDGTRIAFHREEGGNADLYVVNAGGGNPRKLTGRPNDGSNPVWRPDPVALPAYVPLYEPADCQFAEPSGYEIECGYLTVPEDRSQPTGRQIRLHTAIVKSTSANPEPDPVVHLVGGPGGSLLDDIVPYLGRGGDEILEERDYIMFNQRGTHFAEPFLECPGHTELQWELAGQVLPLEEWSRRQVEFLLDCHDDLLDQGINLSAYNSAENAADVNDLRIALGYEQINLYGVSYGSRLALTTMRDHPEGIRSAIVDAVLPLQANLNQEFTLNAHRALQAVFEDCAADADCSQAYPDLEATFYQLVDELNTHPVSLQVGEGTVVVDGYDFVDAVFRLLYSTGAIPWIPFLIDEASRGEYPELSIFAPPDRSTMGWGMHYSVWCREEVPFESQEEALAVAAELPSAFSDLFAAAYEWTVCASWQAGVADPIENQAVVSDIPTLVLSGRYDPVTPPAWGRLAAETLANSFVYGFPNVAHGAMRSNSCALEIGLQFLDDPTVQPDASCLGELEGPEFR